MVYLYVKREGTLVSDAINISYTKKLNSINYASFEVKDIMGDQLDTWEGYLNDDVGIYLSSDDSLLWEGYIDNITESLDNDGTVLTIGCIGMLGKLQRYVAGNNGDVNFVIDEGIIQLIDEDLIYVYNDEGEWVAGVDYWEDDEHIVYPRYAILSDDTLGTDTMALENEGNDYVGFSDFENADNHQGGDYTDVGLSPDSNFWSERYFLDNINVKKMLIGLDIADETYDTERIAVTSTIKTIRLTGGFTVWTNYTSTPNPNVSLALSIGKDTSILRAVKYFTVPLPNDADNTTEYTFNLEIDVNDDFEYFKSGGSYYEDGYVGFVFTSPLALTGCNFQINWDFLTVEIDSDTTTFSGLNSKIISNEETYMKISDDAESAGCSPNDKWKIGMGAQEAFGKCFEGTPDYNISSIPYEINKNVDLGMGIATRYYGSDGYELWTNLCEHFTLEYFEEIDNGNTTLYSRREDDFTDGGELTGFSCSNNLNTQNNQYGAIIVVWKDGIEPYVNDADIPTLYKEIRKDILTKKEAHDRAEELATKYSGLKRSISLSWDEWKLLQLGYTYDFTISETYEDQILRSVTVSQDGAKGQFNIVAEIGGGNTPVFEELGREVGLLKRKSVKNDSLALTATYSPVTRHNSLNGIGTSDHHVKYTDAEAVSAMGAKADNNPLNHDIYEDADAVSAMGAKADANPLNHDRYEDSDAVAAVKAVATDVSYESKDLAAYTIRLHTSTDNDTIILNFTDGQYESKSAGITVDADNMDEFSIPTSHTWVEVFLSVYATSANASNFAVIYKNGNTNYFQGLRVYAGSTAYYNQSAMGRISCVNGKIMLQFNVGAGDVYAYIALLRSGKEIP